MEVPLKARCISLVKKMPSFGQGLKICTGDAGMSSYPLYYECQGTMGIRVPHVLLIPNQTWAHPFPPMTRTWRQSPWGKTLREGVDSRLSHRWVPFSKHNQKSVEKTLSVRKTPLDLALASVGTLELNRRPNTLSRVSKEACSAKLKEIGRKKPSLSTPSGASSDSKITGPQWS